MTVRRRSVVPGILIAAAVIALPYLAKPVEARSLVPSNELVNSMFSASNFPMDPMIPGQAPALPDGKGKELVEQKCVMCHAANIWTSQRHTRDEWGSVLDNMVSKGLDATDDQLDTIATYLAQNFGPIAKPAPAAPPAAPPSDPAATKPPAR